MCTLGGSRGVLDADFPFADDKHRVHIYATPERRAAHGPQLHCWAFGAGLGPKAAGTWSNRAEGAVQPQLPPALRRGNYREFSMILVAPNQGGLPCSINADASLGWAAYCYQSWEVLLNQCQGDQSILLRLEGFRSRGSDAPRQDTAQLAECPRCSCITHVLGPASSAIGKPDRRPLGFKFACSAP